MSRLLSKVNAAGTPLFRVDTDLAEPAALGELIRLPVTCTVTAAFIEVAKGVDCEDGDTCRREREEKELHELETETDESGWMGS